MTSSTMAPVDVSTIETKSDSDSGTDEIVPKEQEREPVPQKDDTPRTEDVAQSDKSFEDGSGDVKEDNGSGSGQEVSQDQGAEVRVEDKQQEGLEESIAKDAEEKKDDLAKGQTFSDENGKLDGGEGAAKDGDGVNTDGGEVGGNKETDGSASEEKPRTDGDNGSGEETALEEKDQGQIEQKLGDAEQKDSAKNKPKGQGSPEVFPDPAQSELLSETNQTGKWATQAAESSKEKEKQKQSGGHVNEYMWKLCNVTAGADYIPCLDNLPAISKLRSTKHYEHRERHCPDENPTCLVPLPQGYKQTIAWPNSRDKIWYANVPHTKLAEVKGHQNWVKATGEYLTFPGGGTQFKHGALHYIDFIQESLPDIAWGKQTRVILDVGCGVASFGGYLFDRDVLAMSFAPKDEHEAQVQFALERGIPAISAVMGTKRLPYPSMVFDVIHCARCRVPWHIEGGMLLLELNRLLRPGGYFVWSATPVYQKLPEDQEIWKAMSALTKSMCWEMAAITKDTINGVGIAYFRKPISNDCYDRRVENSPPICKASDDPNAAWNIQLQACMHKIPVKSERGSEWPEQWPMRLNVPPSWMNSSQIGVYGQSAPEDFKTDYEHWKRVVSKSYLNGMGIDWSKVRNVMDMRAVYGGFAAALKDMKVWVMNVVSIDSADTLPIIYERGLFGMYHDWCESFSTYPRTYDLLHADHLFSRIKKRCKLLGVMVEADRMLRPQGKLIVRDNVETIAEVESIARSLKWEIRMSYSKQKEGLLCVEKSTWRPVEYE